MKKIWIVMGCLATLLVFTSCGTVEDKPQSDADSIAVEVTPTPTPEVTEPTEDAEDVQAEAEQENQSEVYAGYMEAINIKFEDLQYNDSDGRYIYQPLDLPIDKDETNAYETWGKEHGVETLSSDALYISLVRRVETFYEGKELLYANWKAASAHYFFDFEPLPTWDEMKPYMDDISQYITEDKPMMGILKKFSSLQTVQGSFDFSGDTTATVYGNFDFYIPDLSATAQEMGIKERMLGYILAFIDVYGPETEITGTSYTCKLSFSPVAGGSEDDATDADSPTLGEQNALEAVQDYLGIFPFSYTRLVEQLEHDGYTEEEAAYAVENCGADWNEQAAECAKQYIALSPFSRTKLIEQLEHEGFTHSQAVYGVEAVGY